MVSLFPCRKNSTKSYGIRHPPTTDVSNEIKEEWSPAVRENDTGDVRISIGSLSERSWTLITFSPTTEVVTFSTYRKEKPPSGIGVYSPPRTPTVSEAVKPVNTRPGESAGPRRPLRCRRVSSPV